MELLAFTIIAVAFITAIFFTWFFMHKAKEEERQLLIERGADLSELPERGTVTFRFPWLKLGCVFTMGCIGLLIGLLLEEHYPLGVGGEPLLGMLIMGGIGMIIAHYVSNDN